MVNGKYNGAGDLRESVTIQQVSEARDGIAVTPTVSTLFSTRARVEPIRGMERAALAQTQADTEYRVIIRKRSTAVTQRHRVLWDSRTLDIQAVIDPGAEGRWLELMCKEHRD